MTQGLAQKTKYIKTNKSCLLLVENDLATVDRLRCALLKEFEIVTAFDPYAALSLFEKKKPRVVILGLGFSPKPNNGQTGLELLEKIIKLNYLTKVIVVNGSTEREIALKAIRMGAFDFYHKPIKTDELRVIIKRAFHIQGLERENMSLQYKIQGENQFENLIGQSKKMLEIFSTIKNVARSDIPVLVIGESGTGKELVSRAIHNQSDRKENPFVAINCGAIPETLLESELFGHERGSFTGAYAQQKGKVESANGGTLFLDEIGELPFALQKKLLRFLQEHTIERIGGIKSIHVDTRIIAATQRNLLKASQTGDFRSDLYYRLSVIRIDLPSLRYREDDILLLAKYFLNRYCNETNKIPKEFSQEAISAILSFQWPGNIRELENRIRRAVILSKGPLITIKDLDFGSSIIPENHHLSMKEARTRAEINVIRWALDNHNGNITKAAFELGISRPTLNGLIRKHKIRKIN